MQKINVLEIDDDVIGLYSEILGGGKDRQLWIDNIESLHCNDTFDI